MLLSPVSRHIKPHYFIKYPVFSRKTRENLPVKDEIFMVDRCILMMYDELKQKRFGFLLRTS